MSGEQSTLAQGPWQTASQLARSDQIGDLVKALAEAQKEFKPILKDTSNPYYNSKYADLSTVIASTQEALAKNGIVVIQSPHLDPEAQKAGVVTMLAHSSGQWISHDLMLPATMKGKDGSIRFDSQSVGSAVTYARRYAYQAFIGVQGETDDDGNLATGLGTKEAAQAVAQQKIAAKAAAQETIFLAPDGDMVYLSGFGLNILRSAASNDAQGKVGLVQLSNGWAIPVTLVVPFTSLCAEHKVAVHLAEQAPAVGKDNLQQAGPGTVKRVGTMAPGYFQIDALSTKTAKKADKHGNMKFISLVWNGKTANVATWFFPGMVGILTEAYTKGTPVKLMLEESGKYVNVVGVADAEKGDDGIWRFPRQIRDDIPPPPDEYLASDDDIPESLQ